MHPSTAATATTDSLATFRVFLLFSLRASEWSVRLRTRATVCECVRVQLVVRPLFLFSSANIAEGYLHAYLYIYIHI